ncbi:hypothetical protein BDBG_17725 [Blastomyces gilchristii SLH14081]|uniref:PWI domain-containing protein n=1 Tax=Blastomyces gilchristii (strain SLH14081) TaxID=559298 RepID=A0A179UYM9_BLAGS|nr:uncharacterized protein BDBG_17725 [Blastomyces gilchristii SLH14081]OAT12923.1 hypothetical protein BDBG_17725 [Blastomyces gilchristii SLH14081]
MDIRTYISDSLLRLTGASDATVIDYILATTGSVKSAGSLQEKLGPFLDGNENEIHSFCAELWRRVRGSSGAEGDSGTKASKEQLADGLKKRYRLVEMEEDDMDVNAGLAPLQTTEVGKKSSRRAKENGDRGRSRDGDDGGDDESRHKRAQRAYRGVRGERKREREGDHDRESRHRSKKVRRRNDRDFEDRWGDEEIPEDEGEMYDEQLQQEEAQQEEKEPTLRSQSPRSSSPSSDGDPETRAERARQRDLKERDEFAKRLAEKGRFEVKENRRRSIVHERLGCSPASRAG